MLVMIEKNVKWLNEDIDKNICGMVLKAFIAQEVEEGGRVRRTYYFTLPLTDSIVIYYDDYTKGYYPFTYHEDSIKEKEPLEGNSDLRPATPQEVAKLRIIHQKRLESVLARRSQEGKSPRLES